ncbi:MAG: DedA family protein [Pseudomonadota bacterium]
MTEHWSLLALLLSSFLAATLLPGGSEAVLLGVLKHSPELYFPAIGVATLGNTLGGMTSYMIGRLIPPKEPLKGLAFVRRYGSAALLFAWAPVAGDALCVTAGWLRVNPWWSAGFMALGKLARYLAIAQLAE